MDRPEQMTDSPRWHAAFDQAVNSTESEANREAYIHQAMRTIGILINFIHSHGLVPPWNDLFDVTGGKP